MTSLESDVLSGEASAEERAQQPASALSTHRKPKRSITERSGSKMVMVRA